MVFFYLTIQWYAKTCSSYKCYIMRATWLSYKLPGQGYFREDLKSSLIEFYSWYGDLIEKYEVPLSKLLHEILDHSNMQWHLHWSDITLTRDLVSELDLINDFYLINYRIPNGPVPIRYCMCLYNLETCLSYTCYVSETWISKIHRYFYFACDLVSKLHLITDSFITKFRDFHRTFATGAASKQRMLTPPLTRSCLSREIPTAVRNSKTVKHDGKSRK